LTIQPAGKQPEKGRDYLAIVPGAMPSAADVAPLAGIAEIIRWKLVGRSSNRCYTDPHAYRYPRERLSSL
jgi:hypothetical protein